MHRLPSVLEREPLVDALFEVRVDSESPLADVLTGFLLHELGSDLPVTRLPAADLPLPVRKNDNNLKYKPIQRIELDRYFVTLGDQNFSVICKLPYPKWPEFKSMILKVVNTVDKIKIVGKISRYSLKYVNVVSAGDNEDQISKTTMKFSLGDIDLRDQHISVQFHEQADHIVHIYSIVTGATAKLEHGGEMSGILVDIDSIKNVDIPSIEDMIRTLEPSLEELRQENKMRFFRCLTQAAIDEMGPLYD